MHGEVVCLKLHPDIANLIAFTLFSQRLCDFGGSFKISGTNAHHTETVWSGPGNSIVYTFVLLLCNFTLPLLSSLNQIQVLRVRNYRWCGKEAWRGSHFSLARGSRSSLTSMKSQTIYNWLFSPQKIKTSNVKSNKCNAERRKLLACWKLKSWPVNWPLFVICKYTHIHIFQ